MPKPFHAYHCFILIALLLAGIVIGLGAYTRLSDAGLGCPDWPACYGHWIVSEQIDDSSYTRPLEPHKAWIEMIHRYAAASLGLIIVIILVLAWRRQSQHNTSLKLPSLLLAVVIFQGLLGMWTVTHLLTPTIVTLHLLGGLTTLALLWWLWLKQFAIQTQYTYLTLPVFLALALLIGQIFLGGWTSTNYAALACGIHFPQCLGQWLPPMDFQEAFQLSYTVGINYEFGVLESPTRTAIHMTHRIGALIVSSYFLVLALYLITTPLARWGYLLLLGLSLQIGLGISNVLLALPLSIAVMHNLGAAFLLLITLGLLRHVKA